MSKRILLKRDHFPVDFKLTHIEFKDNRIQGVSVFKNLWEFLPLLKVKRSFTAVQIYSSIDANFAIRTVPPFIIIISDPWSLCVTYWSKH